MWRYHPVTIPESFESESILKVGVLLGRRVVPPPTLLLG